MTVYGPDITDALETYSTQFDDIKTQERKPIIDLNAVHELSELRESWTNTETTDSEHRLSTDAGTTQDAFLETDADGQYTAGYEAQAGVGVRVPSPPSQDGIMRWGFWETPAVENLNPRNGWYFGVDENGVFVAEVDNSNIRKVYQEDWNIDICDGSGDADVNPSGFDLDLAKGNIFQISFVYYGYGPVKMQILSDEGVVTVHEFTHDGKTSISNTNLPIRVALDNQSTSSDANEMFVGGRQFSIAGEESTNRRNVSHFRASSQTIDDSQWHPLISIKIKDGTDIGSVDFTPVLGEVDNFEIDTDNTTYRWQVRVDTQPNDPIWETPSSHSEHPTETAMKVDTNSTSIGTGSGLTGIYVDGGTLQAGGNNEANIFTQDPSGQIVGEQVVTLCARALSGTSGMLSEIQFKWTELW